MPPVLAERLVAVVGIGVLTVPISPAPVPEAPSFKLTVVAMSCPVVSTMPPVPDPVLDVRLIVPAVPVPAAMLPFILIWPLPPASGVVLKSNVSPLPTVDALRLTDPVLLRKALPPVLTERLLVTV